jgi:hypothetical protein
VAVYAGYYDTHHSNNLKPKPDPWLGASNVVFIGTPDNSSGGWDTSTIRIDNLTSGTISGVTVTCDIGSKQFALWGTTSIPAGKILILAQTGFENFDGSDTNPAGCYSCPASDCTTKKTSTVPVIHLTIGSTRTDYFDTGQVLNTNGVDAAGCPYTGTRNDESENWVQILPSGATASRFGMSEAHEPRNDAIPVRRDLWLAASPNPTLGDLDISFRTPVAGLVRLGVYDVTGRLMKTVVHGVLEAGEHRQRVELAGAAPGIYFCNLWTKHGVLRRAIVLMR